MAGRSWEMVAISGLLRRPHPDEAVKTNVATPFEWVFNPNGYTNVTDPLNP